MNVSPAIATTAKAHAVPAPEARAPTPVEHFTPAPPEVHPERILRIQGYSDLTRVRPAIRRAAEAMAAEGAALSAPRVASCESPIASIDPQGVELAGGTQLACAAFERQLAGCTAIASFVLTLGPALPARVIELADAGDLLEAVLLETAGWLAIEDATRQFKSRLRAQCLRRGRRITSRMGPGYSYKVGGAMVTWGLEDHPALFSLFGGAPLPVTLLASSAMSPKMSRSGIYGIGPLPGPTSRGSA